MNSNTIPVWLLDIDGVVNAFPESRSRARREAPGNWRKESWTRRKVGKYAIVAAQPVLDFLTRIHDEGLAEIRWHTTWQDKALDFGDAMGLPTFHIQEAPEFLNRADNVPVHLNGALDWWKLPAALRVVEDEKRPLLWTDDDATCLGRDDWARIWADGPGTAMVIAPNTLSGLVLADLDRIGAWLTIQAPAREGTEWGVWP